MKKRCIAVVHFHKTPYYYHTGHRNSPGLRKLSPEPAIEMNPETGKKLNPDEYDNVYIETPSGKIRQRLRWNEDLDPNILTDDSYPCDPAMGAPTLRGIMCKVYKYNSGPDFDHCRQHGKHHCS